MDSLKGSIIKGILLFVLSEQAAQFSPSKFLGGLVIVRSSGGFWRDSLVPSTLFILVIIRSSWKEYLATASDFPGSLVLAFYYFRIMVKKVSWDFFLALLWAYFFFRISSFSVRK